MLNKKFLFLTIAFLLSNVNCANAENLTLKDLEFPKPPAYSWTIRSARNSIYSSQTRKTNT